MSCASILCPFQLVILYVFRLVTEHSVPEDKRMLLFTYLRLAASFSNYDLRLKCVQARLQSLSVLIYR